MVNDGLPNIKLKEGLSRLDPVPSALIEHRYTI
jgi:hypothetical protein